MGLPELAVYQLNTGIIPTSQKQIYHFEYQHLTTILIGHPRGNPTRTTPVQLNGERALTKASETFTLYLASVLYASSTT